jgi:hypothetical protein
VPEIEGRSTRSCHRALFHELAFSVLSPMLENGPNPHCKAAGFNSGSFTVSCMRSHLVQLLPNWDWVAQAGLVPCITPSASF